MLLDFDAPEVTPKWKSISQFCVHGLEMASQVSILEAMPISFCILNTKGSINDEKKSKAHHFSMSTNMTLYCLVYHI